MSSLRLRSCLLLSLLALAACAGDGEGLDANGNPIGSGGSGSSTGGTTGAPGGGSGAITASFQSIQDNVFTPICSVCHQGAGAPEGMQLSAGVSYDMIVGVPSQEQPELDRIEPGNPDNSYLVQKIEGVAATGAQMPDGCPVTQPCLDQATINAIVQWVSDGAPNN
jgi:hypothetical protein